MTEHDETDPRFRLRQNRSDPLYDQQLQRDAQVVNEQTARALGPLPPGGLLVQPKRKPQLAHPTVSPVTPALPPSDEDTTMQWKSAAAVAALATGSTLAACGAEGTTARVDPPAVAVPQAPAPAPLPTVDAAEPARGPVIPAEQLRRQILALLGSFQALKDLERENVERAFGVRMNIDPEAEDGYTYLADTTEGWLYRIDISHFSPKGSPATVEIILSNGVDYSDFSTNQQPTYCTLEFEPLANELVAMGYERADGPLRFKGEVSWDFDRSVEPKGAKVAFGVYLYSLRYSDGRERTCVKSFRIQGVAGHG